MSSEQDFASVSPKSSTFPSRTSSASKSIKSSLITIVRAQTSFLVSYINNDNFDRTASEIRLHIDTHGRPIRLHLLRLLLVEEVKNLTRIDGPSDSAASRLLKDHVRLIVVENPELIGSLCEAIAFVCKNESLVDLEIARLFERLELDPVDQVTICIAIYPVAKKQFTTQVSAIIQANLSKAIEIIGDTSLAKIIPDSVLESYLTFFTTSDIEAVGITSQDVESLQDAVKSRFTSSILPDNLRPFLKPETTPTQTGMADNENHAILGNAMQELGYSSCTSVSAIKVIFERIGGEIHEEDVAQALGMMARTHTNADGSGSDQTWDVEVFVSALNEVAPNLDWVKVMDSLDYNHFAIYDPKGLEIVTEAFRKSPNGQDPFPAHVFFRPWANLQGQLSALYQMALAPPEVLNLNACEVQRVILMEDFANASGSIRTAAQQLAQQQLNCLDLIETVIGLANSEVFEDAKLFMERIASKAPEIVFLGLPIKNILHQELITRLLAVFLNGHSGSSLVFTRLWQLNYNLLLSGFLDLYNKDATTLSRILDVAQDLKILSRVLQVKPFSFSIDLAALASRREYLNLEKWLLDNIAEHKDVFIRACLDFLTLKIASDVTWQDTNAVPQSSLRLSVEVMAIFLRVLVESSMSPENAELLKEVHSACLQSYPKLMNVRSGGDSNSTGGEVSFSEDVEEEANSYYEQIYRGDISIDYMIELLQRFKNSTEPREQDVFACMIHNLFDEYRFFPKYPEKELAITGVLFGSLIQYQLVSYIPLGIALRIVLDALRQPAGSKMFGFGVQALLKFQSRLPEWPQYCSHLLQIQQLHQTNPGIIQYIQTTLQGNTGQAPEDSAPPVSDSFVPNAEAPEEAPVKEARPVFTALNVDTLLANADQANFEIPSESVQDKILFIINNVAQSNLDTKTTELKDILNESAYQWFSNYLVVKRASIEPNYHQLYLLLLEALETPQLYRHVLHETYANIKILLNSGKTVQSSSERALLKNLGSWLGGMTLARNKPIKHKNIAFKELLIEGYDNNRLIVVIPFVCKVLEQCSKSKVFKPPNPWLMAILRLLVELYQNADLKLNLKFEIEVLCKSLSLELNEIDPTTILKNRPPKELVAEQSALPDTILQRAGEGGYGPSPRVPGGSAFMQGPQENHFATSPSLPDESMTINLPNLTAFIVFNPNLTLFATQPTLRRLIIGPVVERSVTIAGLSTRDMIIKDFAMEPDENKMRKAAHLMVQNLAGHLAMVTCKEPLRVSMATHMRTLFLQSGFNEQTLPEQAIMLVVNDNSEMACSIIEKAAMEKAVPEIDEALLPAYTTRKKHRERNQPFFDMSVFASRYPTSLPEPLRLKPNGLQQQQLRVYEDFARIPRMQNQLTTYETDRAPRVARPEVSHPYGYANEGSYEGAQAQASAQQIIEKFSQFIGELDKQISQTSAVSFNALPQNHDIRLLVRQIPVLASQSHNRGATAMTFAQKVVQQLYKSESNLGRETYVVLLERLCETSPEVAKEVINWFLYSDEDRKFNVPVTVTLIKSRLISLDKHDVQLAKLIESGRPLVIEFTTKLIRTCVFEEPSCGATPHDFLQSLEALNRLAQRGRAPESALVLLDDITHGDENAGLREKLQYLFADWVRIYQLSSSNEKVYLSFLTQLAQHGVFKGEDISSMFFRICTETCVDLFLKNKPLPATVPTASYEPIDAFSKLIVLLVKNQTDPTNVNNNTAKINQLSKILSIIVLVLAQQHEQRRHQFNQKPFLRLFSSLLNDFNSYEHQFQPIYFQILSALGNTFYTLQPLCFPGFTFAWLQLISHRLFMPKLLIADHQKGWPVFQRLLICLFTFLVPFLRNVELRETTRMLYRGTLRVLLVLLHDFPEFLCDFHFSFCDVIPASCIQLRNLILSAFPRNMRLPDPFTPNLKVDLLPEINQSPRVLSDYSGALLANNFKQDIDIYLKSRAPVAFLLDLRSKLLLDPNSAEAYNTGSKYNVPAINALVLYVGIQAITQGAPITHSAPMDIFQQLLLDLDSEGRYLFLSAIANQLRYPNSHTHYFSCVLLYLFAEGNQEIIKEQVTRVLLERLIVNRPHPWGLLITFIELIKNPRYNFWNHSFTRCATDIERLFDSVSR
ncbi:hypothetical protein BC937DRAFT_86816 [Endogone sp. FLAS-F59071]|nr:hypothetical protein BC937DRAFT_86816 [Endogone sp. FLAS-F59071]|eukprot:RUS19853.1 hypothetical protein BC937DRAFT_86816 [Endogone sp. FLAS-F59071]